MPAPLHRLLAACLCLGALGVSAAPFPAAAQGNSEPLAITVTSMTPAAIASDTKRGRLVIQGSVRNTSHEDWTDLTVYLAPGSTPLSTEEDLSAAVSAEQAAATGARLAGPGQAVPLPDLPAGDSTDYELSVPISDLGLVAGPGVYPLTVEVLGSGPQGYDDQPDGQVSTFVPLMKRNAAPASLSVIVPFRAAVARAPDGSLVNVGRWVKQVGSGGRLANVLGFALQATIPINLLVDPAVLDAVGSVSAGNPATGEKGTPDVEPAASGWLQGFAAVGRRSTVLALPYGDLDVGAAIGYQKDGIRSTARQLSQSGLSAYQGVPVIAPRSGTLTPSQLRALQNGDHAVLDSQTVSNAEGAAVVTRTGATLTLTSSLFDSLPTTEESLTLLRQVVLSDLAVRSLSGNGQAPVVLSFPAHWRGPSASQSRDFFSGLDQPWVSGVSLPVAEPDSQVVGNGRFTEPAEPPPAVPLSNFVAADTLVESSTALAQLLDTPSLQDAGERQALLAVSENVADHPKAALDRTGAAIANVTAALNAVSLSGPSFVTMSSGTGSFQVTITNKLGQDVVVGLSTDVSTPDLTVKAIDPVTVAAGQQRSVRVTIASHHLGVYRVTLHPVTADGTPLPSSLIVSVRGSQIGQIIWVILGAAACLLFVTIGLRLIRRIRGRRG